MSKVADVMKSMDYGPAPEETKAALAWIASHDGKFGVFVGGEWAMGPETFATMNPATGQKLAEVTQAGAALVDRAVQAARDAQPAWAALPATKRTKVLYALARAIQRNSRLFAVLETMDNGKPIRESRDIDVPVAARHFYHHAGWASLAATEFPDYEPVGVCGQVIPWNFPLMMLAWKVAPALAAGNTVVLKPAEATPLTALLFAETCQAVGVPPGVVNIVTGDGETGKLIVGHPGIDKVAFTGSTEVGRIIRESTAHRPIKLSLELGGKSPFVVFEDADLDSAVEGLVDAIWFNQGQVCCAGSRLLVQEAVAEKLYAKLRARMAKLRTGDPLDKAVDLGAIVDQTQLARIGGLVEQGVREGATLYQPPCEFPPGGWFYPPTLLTDVEPASTVAQVEIFGPVLVCMTFRTPDEAVALANNTVYGLAASVWTQNIDLAHDIADRVKAGTVWVNCTNQFDATAGFGGYRESGFGREGGREGLFEYLQWRAPIAAPAEPRAAATRTEAPLDRTHKLYIGGKQVRPDGGYSVRLGGAEFAIANRKDVRNAVEAARAAQECWAKSAPYLRSQILYYLAENLVAARPVFLEALWDTTEPEREFDAAVNRVLHFAAWADKYDGRVHQGPARTLVYTRNEPLGVVGAFCPAQPSLLGLLGAVLPVVAMGNAVVACASELNPLPACELYRVLEASDVPAGVVNLLTGSQADVLKPLSGHLEVSAVWHFGQQENAALVRRESVGNLKQTWIPAAGLDWFHEPGEEWLRRATQVKNVWVPYGA